MTAGQILADFGLDANSVDFLGHALALMPNDDYLSQPCRPFLEACKLYGTSIDQYGSSPYLYPVYGLVGLPEGFARLSAVYGERAGGCFMLNTPVVELLRDDAGKCVGIVAKEQGGQAKAALAPVVIGEPSYFDKARTKPVGQVAIRQGGRGRHAARVWALRPSARRLRPACPSDGSARIAHPPAPRCAGAPAGGEEYLPARPPDQRHQQRGLVPDHHPAEASREGPWAGWESERRGERGGGELPPPRARTSGDASADLGPRPEKLPALLAHHPTTAVFRHHLAKSCSRPIIRCPASSLTSAISALSGPAPRRRPGRLPRAQLGHLHHVHVVGPRGGVAGQVHMYRQHSG